MVYVHVPFCRSFCTYCDFYSRIPRNDGQDFGRWAENVLAEAGRRRDEIVRSLGCNTVYFGGGTPSVLPLSVFERVAGGLLEITGKTLEFTVEVNPEDIVRGGLPYVRGLTGAGVNRISMGVQSLCDGTLWWMNRRHDSERAVQAFRILREAGVGNISVDVIFGINGLPDATLEDTLRRLLELGPEHFSAYQLSIEDGSALSRMISAGKYSELPDEGCERQYGIICEMLSRAGYRHYEISNWALPGREAVHNSAYWKRLPYVGLGPGAHSLTLESDGRQIRSWNAEDGGSGGKRSGGGQEADEGHRNAEDGGSGDKRQVRGRIQTDSGDGQVTAQDTAEQNPVRSADCAPAGREILSAEDIRVERVMLALRTSDGLPETELKDLCPEETVTRMVLQGELVRTGTDSLRIPEEKMFVSEGIIRDLL